MRFGRDNPAELRPDDQIDFWLVEAVEPGRLLRLRAQMRLPGTAWLEIEVMQSVDGAAGSADDPQDGSTDPLVSSLVLRSLFHPRGLLGRAYWYSVLPLHGVAFGGIARDLALAAEQRTRASMAA